jgi:hypothetical protein
MSVYYSQIPYRSHLVCFQCRRTVKHIGDDVRCSQCSQSMTNLGRKLHVPPRNNLKQWQKLRLLYQSGWRGHDWDIKPKMKLRTTKEYLAKRPERERAALRQGAVQKRADELEKNRRRNIKRRLNKKIDAQRKAANKYQETVLNQAKIT